MFKIVIPLEKGKAAQVEKDAPALVGMKIGDKFDGSMIGLNGYTLQVAGGSDKEGFPMRRDLPGTARKKALLVGGVGCKTKGKGVRTIKTIRGNRIGEDIVQVNVKIAEKGKEKVEKLLGLEKAPEGETKPDSEPAKEEPKTETKEPVKEEAAKEDPKKPKEEEPKPEEKEQAKEEPKKEEKAEPKDGDKKEEPKKEEKPAKEKPKTEEPEKKEEAPKEEPKAEEKEEKKD